VIDGEGRERIRTDRLRASLEEHGIALAAVADPANLQWLLGRRLDGLERFTALLVSPSGMRVVLPSFDVDELVADTGIDDVEGWPDDRGPGAAIASALGALGADAPDVVAVDAGMPFRFLRELPSPSAGYRSVDELITPMRMVKDEAELERIARTSGIVSEAIDLLPGLAAPGVTEAELRRALLHALLDLGADTLDYVLVQAGAQAASPHHDADETPLAEGEAVLVDIALSAGGYYADITQQVSLGEPGPRYEAAYAIVHEAQLAGVAAARAGATAGDVAQTSHAVIADSEFAGFSYARIGHGIGLDVHEAPALLVADRTALEPGTTVTVEPGIYVPGEFGIRIEDTIAVTDGEPWVMTRGSRPLTVVEG
jgi:Xaa-Pro dipeptidase